MIKRYINLTNGIEAIDEYDLSDYSFIRIQSTACEQHLWDRLILDLDYDFLMNAAIGNECVIYDYGTNKPVPRAIYQGVEFIKFVLNKFWYGVTKPAVLNKGRTASAQPIYMTKYFEQVYTNLSEQVHTKLRYFLPFLSGSINIRCVTSPTCHDGHKQYYARIVTRQQGDTISTIV